MFWHVSVHPSICLSAGGYPSQVQIGRGGGPHPGPDGGGVTWPGPDGGSTPARSRSRWGGGGYPSQVQMGGPQDRIPLARDGVPPSWPEWGGGAVPQQGPDGWGSPHPGQDGGIPWPGPDGDGYPSQVQTRGSCRMTVLLHFVFVVH